jgi:tetratricopeptide (TPR) repeat protein
MRLRDSLSAEECAKQLSEAHPEKIVSSVTWAALYGYRGERSKAIAALEALSERAPGWRAFDRWLADLIAGQGDVERARRLMANAFPEFLEDGLELPLKVVFQAEYDLFAAMVFAAILDANGETQRRDVLLRALEEQIATRHRTRGVGYGILDVYIHAIRGDRDRAIAGLREALDMGWRGGWFYTLRRDWKLANLHQDPEFIAMVIELEVAIKAQRQWYEENKDQPLF